jgi:hypothetical protein
MKNFSDREIVLNEDGKGIDRDSTGNLQTAKSLERGHYREKDALRAQKRRKLRLQFGVSRV